MGLPQVQWIPSVRSHKMTRALRMISSGGEAASRPGRARRRSPGVTRGREEPSGIAAGSRGVRRAYVPDLGPHSASSHARHLLPYIPVALRTVPAAIDPSDVFLLCYVPLTREWIKSACVSCDSAQPAGCERHDTRARSEFHWGLADLPVCR